MRKYVRFYRVLSRIPLRLGFFAIRPVALFNHRIYMVLLLPLLRFAGVTLTGKPRYISPNVFFDDFDKVTLGQRVVISSNVSLLTHDYSLTTLLISSDEYPGKDVAIVRPIMIGNNVFIGRGASILPGTIIEDNVIVGSRAVVRGLIKSGSIVIGNPAKVVKTFSEQLGKIRRISDSLDIRRDK